MQAFHLYQRAAAQGFIAAKTSLARCYRLGIGTKVSPTKAVAWYKQAAHSDSADPQALFELAWCYQSGFGINRDPIMAEQLYLKAMELGHGGAAQQLKQRPLDLRYSSDRVHYLA